MCGGAGPDESDDGKGLDRAPASVACRERESCEVSDAETIADHDDHPLWTFGDLIRRCSGGSSAEGDRDRERLRDRGAVRETDENEEACCWSHHSTMIDGGGSLECSRGADFHYASANVVRAMLPNRMLL